VIAPLCDLSQTPCECVNSSAVTFSLEVRRSEIYEQGCIGAGMEGDYTAGLYAVSSLSAGLYAVSSLRALKQSSRGLSGKKLEVSIDFGDFWQYFYIFVRRTDSFGV